MLHVAAVCWPSLAMHRDAIRDPACHLMAYAVPSEEALATLAVLLARPFPDATLQALFVGNVRILFSVLPRYIYLLTSDLSSTSCCLLDIY